MVSKTEKNPRQNVDDIAWRRKVVNINLNALTKRCGGVTREKKWKTPPA